MSIRPSIVTQNKFDEVSVVKQAEYLETKLKFLDNEKNILEAIDEANRETKESVNL